MDLNGFRKAAETLVEVGRRFELTERSFNEDECKSVAELFEAASSMQQHLFGFDHIEECPRCQSWYQSFRAHQAVKTLPRVLTFGIDVETGSKESTFIQILGTLDLCNRRFGEADDEIDWRPSPTKIRVNFVLDSDLGVASLTLLEVPTSIERICLRINEHLVELQPTDPKGTFEFLVDDESGLDEALPETLSGFSQRVFGSDRIVIQLERDETPRELINSLPLEGLLREFNALESEFEYMLPSGLACETHFNLAKLCHYELVLERLAYEFDKLLPERIDVVVSNGWAMAMIARRITRVRNRRLGRAVVKDIVCEGYAAPVLTDQVANRVSVAIITDVVVTGTQIKRICRQVEANGGRVACTATVVLSDEVTLDLDVLHLLKLNLGVYATCRRSQTPTKRTMHFNPLSNTMSFKKPNARAPSQFLMECGDANQLWSFLHRVVGATKSSRVTYYKRHHIDGNMHYTQFVDTGKLLQHSEFGAEIVERIRDQLAANNIVPDVLLFPDRKRARLFAEKLSQSLELAANASLPLVAVSKDVDGRWYFTTEMRAQLEDRFVLIVDTGIGHGRTVDLFGMAAAECGASRVAVSVILSRLPESAEDAFADRFSGGFFRLFNLPVRPVVIRGTSKESCPYCQRIEAVKSAATESGSDAIEKLSRFRKRVISPNAEAAGGSSTQSIQLSMFEDDKIDSFWQECTPSLAGGVTLHSLYAAKNNGMASLCLPELTNERIPIRNREAMVADLPIGSLQWSQGDLDNDLLATLEQVDAPSVWSAATFALASERYNDWLDKLSSLMERSQKIRNQENPIFWRRLICSAFLTAKDLGELHVESLTHCLRKLADDYRDTLAAAEIERMLGVANATLDESNMHRDGDEILPAEANEI